MMRPRMTILWHSVSPFCASGYGKVTKYVTQGLVELGYRVVISAYYGVEPGQLIRLRENLILVGSKAGPFGVHSSKMYADMFKADIRILHTDWWAFPLFPKLHKDRAILYSPMDSENYDPETYAFTREYWKIVAVSQFSKKDLERHGIKVDALIPHGVDINIFRPMNKEECRKHFNFPTDKFIFGTVAANNDKEDRKNFTGTIKAFKYMMEQDPDIAKDCMLVFFTSPNNPQGYPIAKIVRKYGLEHKVIMFPDNLFTVGIPEQELAKLYNAFDVHVLCSKREGFGIPIIESMACKVPNIVHNYSAPPELVKGRGWLVKSLTQGINIIVSPINSEFHIPDTYDLYEKMKRAVLKDKERKKYARLSRQFALKYNWSDLIHEKWKPFLEQVEEDLKNIPGESHKYIVEEMKEYLKRERND